MLSQNMPCDILEQQGSDRSVVQIMNGNETRGTDEASLKSTADCISNSFMHVEQLEK